MACHVLLGVSCSFRKICNHWCKQLFDTLDLQTIRRILTNELLTHKILWHDYIAKFTVRCVSTCINDNFQLNFMIPTKSQQEVFLAKNWIRIEVEVNTNIWNVYHVKFVFFVMKQKKFVYETKRSFYQIYSNLKNELIFFLFLSTKSKKCNPSSKTWFENYINVGFFKK